MRLLSSLFLLLLFSAAYSDDGLPIVKFRNTPFKVRPFSGLYEISGLNLNNMTSGFQIAAYGDFNNDKYTDFVSIADNSLNFTVFIYSPQSGSFWPFITLPSEKPITGIVPGDFDYNGVLDLMVMTPASDNSSNTEINVLYRTDNYPFFTDGEDDIFLFTPITTLETSSQPLIFDATGDRLVDLLYTMNGERLITSFTDGSTYKFSELVSNSTDCLPYANVQDNAFVAPHSNSFIDFNGDCAADLFLTTQDPQGNLIFEIWLRNPADSYHFCLVDATAITLDEISLVSLGDMNNDGRFDLVYAESPTDTTQDMNLHVVYNHFPADPSTPCRLVDPTMKSPYTAGAYNAKSSVDGNATVTPIQTDTDSILRLFTNNSQTHPPKVRLGDVNVDGYQDILLVVTDPNEQNPKSGKTLLGINLPGGFIFNGTSQSPDVAQYFLVNENNSEDNKIQQALGDFPTLYASFYDFDEKGSLGIWMTVYNPSGATTLTGVYNFVTTPNFILKTLGLNGYVDPNGDDITNSLGAIYHGASVECIVTDVKGNARIAKSTQLSQTSYTALDLPYAFIGLGRTNNYVQDFTMGITQSMGPGDNQQQSWTPIIPNSQLIVNTIRNDSWTLDVFVNPISQTILVVMITLGILLILGLIILLLHIRERNEDKRTQDKLISVFN